MACNKKKDLTLDIVPSVEDLSSEMRRNVTCPVEGCGVTLNHDNALRMHVIKTHRLFQNEKDNAFFNKYKVDNPPCRYHCPIDSCKYRKGAERHFQSYKNLKQHFKCVHIEKKYICDMCGYKFGIESTLMKHRRTCGVIFTCGTCACPYSTREALLTHCRRKQHLVPERFQTTRKIQPVPGAFLPNFKSKGSDVVVSNMNPPSKAGNLPVNVVSMKSEETTGDDQNEDCGGCDESRQEGSAEEHVVVDIETLGVERDIEVSSTQSILPDLTTSDSRKDSDVSYVGDLGEKRCDSVLGGPSLIQNETRTDNMVDVPSLLQSIDLTMKGNQISGASVQPVVNVFVLNLNTEKDGKSVINSIIDQGIPRSSQGNKLASILPRPRVTYKPCSSISAMEPVNSRSTISKTTSVVQTSNFPIDKTSAETQTTGDYVLMKAMQSANIPTQKESRGAQVSPRARTHGVKRAIPTQSTSVQTATDTRHVVRRKRRKKQLKGSEAASTSTTSTFSQATSPTINVPDFLDLGFSDCETQTIALIEELEASLAASTSTQTRESYLANPPTGHETPLPMQTIETQTLSVDMACDTTEGFSLLNFLNSDAPADSMGTRAQTRTPLPSFDEPAHDNPMMINSEDADSLPLRLTTPQLQTMDDVLEAGVSLFDASAQTTEVSTAIQTQTIDTMFHQLLSNMETQTSDDLPFPDLGFMDNQTQTPFEVDLLESQANVETQTALQVFVPNSTASQSISAETQTLFPHLTSTDSHTQTSLADLEKFMNL